MSKKKQILGIGTPIIDYLFDASNEYVDSLPGQRGGSILVDYPTLAKIINDFRHSPQKIIAGGGSANTIKGLAKLDHPCLFSGKIGHDEAGKSFSENMKACEIDFRFSLSDLPTAQVACLITPDHDRTMRAFIGAGAEMSANDLSPELFKDVQHLHIEGYLMNRVGLAEKAMQLAKKAGATISFDLSSFEFVKEYREPMHKLIVDYVDIVFGRDEEAQMLTGLSPDAASEYLKDYVDIAVIKMGADGSMAETKLEKAYQEAYKVNVVDTTGAGDLFASGFLHGLLSGKSLKDCLHYGALVASYVIQVPGAEIPDHFWGEIELQLK